jgi:hypothetical protein
MRPRFISLGIFGELDWMPQERPKDELKSEVVQCPASTGHGL